MGLVAAVRTPTDSGTLSRAIRESWSRIFGRAIRDDVLALYLALADLENGDGVSGSRALPNSFNFNIGNLVLPSNLRTDDRSWFTLKGDDAGGASEHHYKSFPSYTQGVDAFVRQLMSDTRSAWREGLLTGDPEEFIRALNGQRGGPKYFEADFDRYLTAYLGRWAKYVPSDTPIPERGPEPLPSDPFEDDILKLAVPLAMIAGGIALLLKTAQKRY